MSERLAVIWTNFGPYHMARIRAMKPLFDVKAIELASDQRLYRWWKDDREESTYTLTTGDWEDQSKLRIALKLWRTLDSLRPSILLVPGYASLPALSAALWGRMNAATVVLMSESNFDDHPRRTIGEGIKSILVRLLYSGGIVGGKRAALYLRQLGIKEDKIAFGYDVVDNQYYATRAAQCRVEESAPLQSPYFLFVGRLAREKNVATLLKAHEVYLNSGGTWPLMIVGDGPLKQALHEQAQPQIQGGKVVFAGRKSVLELPSFYAFAGCFVLASAREPWGLVVNEAMASSLPVIASSRCGCADDLVEHGSNGYLIEPGDVDDIAEKLIQMTKLTAEERTKMGKQSLEIIDRYSPERWASEVMRIASALGRENHTNGL
jgi:glycosyltransferase involved in cell wall biosynthesis